MPSLVLVGKTQEFHFLGTDTMGELLFSVLYTLYADYTISIVTFAHNTEVTAFIDHYFALDAYMWSA